MTTSTIIAIAVAIAVALFALSITERHPHGIDLDKAGEGDIARLLMAGHKLDAMKVYRRLHRVDLKTAKDAIDKLDATLPKPPKTS